MFENHINNSVILSLFNLNLRQKNNFIEMKSHFFDKIVMISFLFLN